MENKPAQNIQDSFLNTARKDKATITLYLLSGVKLTGRIRSFDKYSVVLETNNQEQLIFKHAISTVVMAKSHGPERSYAPPSDRAEVRAAEVKPAATAGSAAAAPTAPASHSTTES
jgi:host factor-I protein